MVKSERLNDPIWCATVEYHFYWLSCDLMSLSRWRQSAGRGAKAKLLRDFARDYEVVRRMKKGAEFEMLDILHQDNPAFVAFYNAQSLVEKADICDQLVRANRALSSRGSLEHSLFSKRLWYRAPLGWTMYDSLASEGLRLTSKGRSRFLDFYKVLDARGFSDRCQSAQDAVDQDGFPDFYPGQILDKYLMARAMGVKARIDIPLYFRALGDSSSHVSDLGTAWHLSLATHSLAQADKRRQIGECRRRQRIISLKAQTKPGPCMGRTGRRERSQSASRPSGQ